MRQLIKNCIYRIMEACKSKIYRMSLEVSDPREPVFQLESKALFCGTRKSWCSRWCLKAILRKILSCTAGAGSFVLLRSSIYWISLIHTVEGNLFHTKFTNFNFNLIKNIITEAARIMINQIPEYSIAHPIWLKN